MPAVLSPQPIFKAFDNNGNPLSNGQLFTYQAGTTIPQATYTDSTLTQQNGNPITLNFRGETPLWLSPTQLYKLDLFDAAGNHIPGWPVDNVTGSVTTGLFSVGSALFPSITFAGSPTTGLYAPATNQVGLSINGVETMLAGTSLSWLGPTSGALVDLTPDQGTFTGTLLGMSPAAQVSCAWSRVGNIVVLLINTTGAQDTSGSNSTSMSLTNVPTAVLPASNQYFYSPFGALDNGLVTDLTVQINASGFSPQVTLLKGKSTSPASWTATGVKGLNNSITCVYRLN